MTIFPPFFFVFRGRSRQGRICNDVPKHKHRSAFLKRRDLSFGLSIFDRRLTHNVVPTISRLIQAMDLPNPEPYLVIFLGKLSSSFDLSSNYKYFPFVFDNTNRHMLDELSANKFPSFFRHILHRTKKSNLCMTNFTFFRKNISV